MTARGTIRVVLVDDHQLFRAGVRAEPAGSVEIVGEASAPAEAVAVIGACAPDVVLLDVHLPDGGGLAVLDAFGGPWPRRPAFLALSVSDAARTWCRWSAPARAATSRRPSTPPRSWRRSSACTSATRLSARAWLRSCCRRSARPRARHGTTTPSSTSSRRASATSCTTLPAATRTSASGRDSASARGPWNTVRQLGAAQAAALLAPRAQPLGDHPRPRRRRRRATLTGVRRGATGRPGRATFFRRLLHLGVDALAILALLTEPAAVAPVAHGDALAHDRQRRLAGAGRTEVEADGRADAGELFLGLTPCSMSRSRRSACARLEPIAPMYLASERSATSSTASSSLGSCVSTQRTRPDRSRRASRTPCRARRR